jgi:hypothetical protein
MIIHLVASLDCVKVPTCNTKSAVHKELESTVTQMSGRANIFLVIQHNSSWELPSRYHRHAQTATGKDGCRDFGVSVEARLSILVNSSAKCVVDVKRYRNHPRRSTLVTRNNTCKTPRNVCAKRRQSGMVFVFVVSFGHCF